MGIDNMLNQGLFTSTNDKWSTPDHVIRDLASVFAWDVDVCASRPNVCERFYTEADNGLIQKWSGLCWMNPPYGREIGHWVRKAKRTALESKINTVVCLLPARTDTRWWHENVVFATQVVFIRGRLRFGDADNSAPFPSAFVVFGDLNTHQYERLAAYGMAMKAR